MGPRLNTVKMSTIVEIKRLNDFVVPCDALRMVFMQPYVEDNLTAHEIYKWKDINNNIDTQINRIRRTLEIAKTNEWGFNQAHFTIFPEYSIPGIRGIDYITTYLENPTESWPNNSVVIGGIEGLDKIEYSKIARSFKGSPLNSITKIPYDRWVNCCVIWIKVGNKITKFVQPKIIPAWPEKDARYQYMYSGKSIYLFEAKYTDQMTFRFATLICADWMDAPEGAEEINILLNALNNKWSTKTDPKPIDLVFIIKHNPKPNDPLFLNPVNPFFSNIRYNKSDRNRCLLIFVNTASGKIGAKGTYGFTGIISHPNSPFCSPTDDCPPTYAVVTEKLRGTNLLGRCKEALFRENGVCIHSCKVIIPRYGGTQANNRNFILNEAHAHAIDPGITDPRVPGSVVPASVKWVNDEIDNINIPHTVEEMKTEIGVAFQAVINEVRWSKGSHLQELVNIGTNRRNLSDNEQQEKKKNVDIWDSVESESLKTIIKSLLVINCNKNFEVKIKDVPFHATIITKDPQGEIKNYIDVIIVISADNTLLHESNLNYLKEYIERVQLPRKVMIISRSDDDHAVLSREKKVTEKNLLCYKYSEIIDCLGATDSDDLNSKLSTLLEKIYE